jgi:hypothetical protein
MTGLYGAAKGSRQSTSAIGRVDYAGSDARSILDVPRKLLQFALVQMGYGPIIDHSGFCPVKKIISLTSDRLRFNVSLADRGPHTPKAELQKLFCRVARQKRSEQTSIEKVSNQPYKEVLVLGRLIEFKPVNAPQRRSVLFGAQLDQLLEKEPERR